MSLGLRAALLAGLAVLVAVPSVASGSILVTENARKPSLRVAANGDAEIRWTNSKGARQSLVVPFKGRVLPGATITGKNVAKRSSRWNAKSLIGRMISLTRFTIWRMEFTAE